MNPGKLLLSPENFDLFRRITEDEKLRQNLNKYVIRLCELEKYKKSRPSEYIEARDKIMLSIWKDCGRNLSLLVPFFFPDYPKGTPMSMFDRPFNMVLMFTLVFWTFTLRGSRQIGKTTSIGTRVRIIMEIFERFRSVYVCPHLEPLRTFGRKYSEINSSFRFPVNDNKLKDNLFYKEYPKNNTVSMVKVQSNATAVRGITADEVDFDESQLLDPNLEVDILEILQDSPIKSVLYTGTSTTSDTLLEYRYQEGVQATWNVNLGDGQTVDCGDPDQVIPCIGPTCMIHPKTGEPINPLNGFYRYNNPAAFENRSFSTHIPQIINPDISNNPLEWSMLHRTLLRDKKKFIQEKLGIPVEEASREITESDLRRICDPAAVPGLEERKERARKGYYRQVISSMDWGGNPYDAHNKIKLSYSVHTIMGVTAEGKIHVLFFRRHSGKDYKTTINNMAADHLKFRAGASGSDFGVGDAYHEILRSHPAFNSGRHIIFHYTEPGSKVCSTMHGNLPRTLNLNRTESLTALIVAMTMPEPMILCPSWEESEEYLKDFLSIHRHLAEKGQTGQRHFLYTRDASKSDDVVHAMNFGYALIRLAYNQLLVGDIEAKNLLRNSVLGSGEENFSAGGLATSVYSTLLQQSAGADQDYYDSEYYDYE